MVKIPNPLDVITKPVAWLARPITKPLANLRDKMVGDAISGGMKHAGGNFLESLKQGVGKIGTFAGNHKKELGLAAGAMAALALSKNMFWPSHTPVPPPPPPEGIMETIAPFLKDNWKTLAPIAGILGVAAPMLLGKLFSGGGNNQIPDMMEGMQQSPQAFLQSITQNMPQTPQTSFPDIMGNAINNIQSGAQTGQGNPFDYQPNVDLSDMSMNGHAMVSPASAEAQKKAAVAYQMERIKQIARGL